MLAARRQRRRALRLSGNANAQPEVPMRRRQTSRAPLHTSTTRRTHQSSSRGPTLLFLSGECVCVCVLSNLYFGYSSSLRISPRNTVGAPPSACAVGDYLHFVARRATGYIRRTPTLSPSHVTRDSCTTSEPLAGLQTPARATARIGSMAVPLPPQLVCKKLERFFRRSNSHLE